MHCLSGNKNAVTDSCRDQIQRFLNRTGIQVMFEVVLCDSVLQTGTQLTIGFGMQNNPCFCFASFVRIVFDRLLVVWVDLQRQPIISIQKLNQQRKLSQMPVPSQQVGSMISN